MVSEIAKSGLPRAAPSEQNAPTAGRRVLLPKNRLPLLRSHICSERCAPLCGDTTEQRRVNDQFSERIDRGHVEWGEGADLADVNGQVEAVAGGSLDERAERSSVHCTIGDLVQLLVRKAVHDAKESVRRPRPARANACGPRQ